MSLLKNFVNPWEMDTGVLETEVLETEVLRNNVLEKENDIERQGIIPTAYLFVNDKDDFSTNNKKEIIKDLKKVKNEVIHIFKKNGILINVSIISGEEVRNKEINLEFEEHDLIVGITNSRDKIGHSGVIKDGGLELWSNIIEIYISDKYINCYISYESIKNTTSSSVIRFYPTGFLMSHEILHQMIIKSYAKMFGETRENNYFPKWTKWIPKSFKIHEDETVNLNTSADKLATLGTFIKEKRSSRLRKEERILEKHKRLLQYWLNPNLLAPYGINPKEYIIEKKKDE